MTSGVLAEAGPETEKFVAPRGKYLGYVVIAAAVVLSAIGLKSQGTGAFGLIGFAIAFSLIGWIVLIRPRVAAHSNGLVMRNMLRDTFVPWASIKTCRVGQMLQVGTRDKVYNGLGLSKSARIASKEERQRRGGGRFVLGPNLGMGSLAAAPEVSPKAMEGGLQVNRGKEEQIAGSYFDHAEQRIETLAKQNAAMTEGTSPRVVWDPMAVGALLLAALGVVFSFYH